MDKEDLNKFRADLGRQLYECRCEKGLRIKDVYRQMNGALSAEKIEDLELGKHQITCVWDLLPLLRLYGRKMRLIIE